jgi:hypothetical protein
MALSIDASAARVTNAAGTSVTTGSFSPAAGTLLLALGSARSGDGQDPTPTVSSSPALTWTTIVAEDGDTLNGITVAAWAVATGGALTVTFSTTSTENYVSLHVLQVTGQHATTPIGASRSGETTTNGVLTNSYHSTVENSRGVFVATDWAGNFPAPTTTDTLATAFAEAGVLSGLDGYKAADTAVVGTNVEATFDGAFTDPAQWTWVVFEVLPAAGGPPPAMTIEAWGPPSGGVVRGVRAVVPSGMDPGGSS